MPLPQIDPSPPYLEGVLSFSSSLAPHRQQLHALHTSTSDINHTKLIFWHSRRLLDTRASLSPPCPPQTEYERCSSTEGLLLTSFRRQQVLNHWISYEEYFAEQRQAFQNSAKLSKQAVMVMVLLRLTPLFELKNSPGASCGRVKGRVFVSSRRLEDN